jgi:hypothetical protein
MENILGYIGCFAVGAVLGAVFGVLWGRKHPAMVASVVDTAKKL